MNDLFAWLLDLDTLQWGAESVRFGFERPLPLWAWPGVVLAAGAFAAWTYSRLTGSVAGRSALAAARALLLIAVVVLIAGPQLVKTDETVERDWVLALVDRSASMQIEDAAGAEGESGRTSREAQLRRAIERSWPMWSEVAEERTVVWLGFDAGAYELSRDEAGAAHERALDLGEPTGRRTSLAAALDQALRRAAARPLSSVVIFSDGRSIDEPDRAALRRLRAERVPVHVVPLGSADPVADLAIRRAEGPRSAFVGDFTPVTVEVERLGAAAVAGGVVRLIDQSTGMVLDERRIDGDAPEETITLTHRPNDPGASTWAVEIIPDGADLIAGNNRAEFAIELVDRPMRLLYIDGYPRWEQRYLKNVLIREKSITSSNLILAPNRRPSQEGDIEIDALPASPEEWAQFDVVVLGDVSPDVFTKDQLQDLREHIAIRGGGLLWIGGPGATPESWWTTPMADLLPFTREALAKGPGLWPAVMVPTALAERFGALRLGATAEDPWPRELSDPQSGWATLRWRQPINTLFLKPTAETLAHAVPVDDISAGDQGSPVILSMRFGAGRIVYVATDETWRWRYGRGEMLFERFWLQLVRLLGRESLARSGRSATITIEPRRAVVEQPVRVAVELLDQALVEMGMGAVAVRLVRTPEPGEDQPSPPVELTLRPDDRFGRSFSATWVPVEAGEWNAAPVDPALTMLDLSADAVVTLPDDELRQPETNHPLLERLARDTEGQVFQVSDLDRLPSELPNRRVRLVNETTEALWDTPAALILVILLLTFEWVGRRLIHLI